ncbi:aquaporin NIP1-2-like [Lycium ferocissimum]|uniref:aquaporin NIP1-2-like n=1 Tax=Lycium ferocissimum TaxID=112874 RepID=UPI002814C099|nr:aquaporin NIP1-2-like [Lycium ferocissimum]
MGSLENQLASYIIDVRDVDERFSNLKGLCDLSKKLVDKEAFKLSSCIAMDTQAMQVGELIGLVIGAVVTINSILAWPISEASMNPARSLGSAILSNCYNKQWIYMLSPIAGAIASIWFYNNMKSVKPYDEVTKFVPFLRG